MNFAMKENKLWQKRWLKPTTQKRLKTKYMTFGRRATTSTQK